MNTLVRMIENLSNWLARISAVMLGLMTLLILVEIFLWNTVKKTTLIAVVHRLDTIRNYDKVGVMKAGKIVEMDTYEKLVARKGMLYELIGKK